MDPFLAFYVDELRSLKRGLLGIFAIVIGYMIIMSVYPFQLLSETPFTSFLLDLGMKLFYLFPLFFAFTLYMEENYISLYNGGSIHMQNSRQMLMKYFVLVDAMILMTLVVFLHAMLMMSGILPHPKTSGYARVGDIRVILSGILRMFSTPFIVLSLVCAAWGVMRRVKRFSPGFGLVVMAVGWLLYHTLVGIVNNFGRSFVGFVLYTLLLTLCLAAVYCAVGWWLGKRAEGVEKEAIEIIE